MFYFDRTAILDNPANYDLDFFIKDNHKLIHISTAGMKLKNSLLQNILSQRRNFKTVLSYRRKFNVSKNTEIIRDNLFNMDSYTFFFNLIASRGFYSYDKYDIDDPEDKRIQLIFRPIYDRKILVNNDLFFDYNSKMIANYKLNFINAKKDFPENFDPFNLDNFI